MLKIGEFSKLSMLTVKALRFYEKERLLIPAKVDRWSGYRYYEMEQLETAVRIKMLRQLDFSLEQIKAYLNGRPLKGILQEKEAELRKRQNDISTQLSIIKYLMEDNDMKYQAVLKELPEMIVYSEERVLESYSGIAALVLSAGTECRRLNPDLECVRPEYGFCEYLDEEHRHTDIRTRYSQAVVKEGKGNERICFRTLPATRAVCVYHRGAYEHLGEAYAFMMQYISENGYRVTGCVRERYIDGMWNNTEVDNWLTEIQFPVE